MGGHLYKKRIRFAGQGKSGSGRTIICYKRDDRALLIQEYSPEQIISIRKRFKLSQAALASIFNISPSTVRKWELGDKKPAGASRKLLDIIERKGLEALI
ncbi:hypothetical protein KKHLCK_05585 [Candidatus Electrothrix laxa]